MKRIRWRLSIAPTAQGLAKHPTWKALPGPVAIYDKADLNRRVREAHAALAAGDITAFHVTPQGPRGGDAA
jgi:hypothetical protein